MKAIKPYRCLLSRKEAAQCLGLSENTLAKWASLGKPNLPFFLIGGRARYDAGDLTRFIEYHRKQKWDGRTLDLPSPQAGSQQ